MDHTWVVWILSYSSTTVKHWCLAVFLSQYTTSLSFKMYSYLVTSLGGSMDTSMLISLPWKNAHLTPMVLYFRFRIPAIAKLESNPFFKASSYHSSLNNPLPINWLPITSSKILNQCKLFISFIFVFLICSCLWI